jgi:hypothetical protein
MITLSQRNHQWNKIQLAQRQGPARILAGVRVVQVHGPANRGAAAGSEFERIARGGKDAEAVLCVVRSLPTRAGCPRRWFPSDSRS